MEQLVPYLAGLISVAALGGLKKMTTVADRKVAAFIKPVQPLVALGLTIGLPMLGNAIGLVNVPNATTLANAPTATIISVAAAEVFARLTKKSQK